MRKLATIRTISEVLPIEGADKIEIVKIDGWQCVVNKGAFVPGQSCVYFEIDSLLPIENTAFSFLAEKAKYRNSVGKLCHRLRTIKLKKQLSQGLALPLNELNVDEYAAVNENLDNFLGIEKYEPPIPGSLAGKVKGNFPSFIPKTDQERVQNLWKDIQARSDTYELSIKLDGSSMTVFRMGDRFGVCSRNWEIEDTEGNAFWVAVRKHRLEEKLRSLYYYDNIALQGELIGPGIQGNNEGLKEIEFRVFDVWDIEKKKYLPAAERRFLCNSIDVPHVPVIEEEVELPDNIDVLLEVASGESLNPKSMREGLVFKSLQDPFFSFKVISNEYLLKHGD